MHIWLLKEEQGAASSKKHETWTLLNFLKSPFFSYSILWRIHFSHIEFCEKSVFLKLNFVKCPKMESIPPPLYRSLKVHLFNEFLIFFTKLFWFECNFHIRTSSCILITLSLPHSSLEWYISSWSNILYVLQFNLFNEIEIWDIEIFYKLPFSKFEQFHDLKTVETLVSF